MAIRTELTLRLQNSPGMLARVCQVIANERINIVAINLASPLVVRVVVDNPTHAAGVLREHHYHVEERDVIYTETSNDPGALLRITRLIADAGVNVEYLYATAIEGQSMASVVVGVPDAERASSAAGL
ncbi:MAG TPA: ACT domain-containing protein [Vicinamibacterales bacterium]|nr:ACT domain-containing protein [Vicinamibacterales bacterium]